MPKKTLFVLASLAVLASLLLGINIGKRLGKSQYLTQTQIPITPTLIPTIYLSPTPMFIRPTQVALDPNLSTYRDETCGFTISYKGSYLEQKTENYHSTIITDPESPDNPIVSTCQDEIPKPPLVEERIEDIILDGVPTKLYHDASSKDGTPRDEVIVKHPTRNHEIIIAGYGPSFNQAIASFKFIP